MIRQFCDGCGIQIAETENVVERRYKRCSTPGNKVIEVEVIVAVDHVWNAGHVCKACLLRTVNEP